MEALDYLVKPLEPTRFREAVEGARRYLARDASLMRRIEPNALRAFLATLATASTGPRGERLAIKVGRKVRFLDPARIEYIGADGDYVAIHLQGEEVLRARDSIAELQARLPPARFLRIHRSLIVNLLRQRAPLQQARRLYTRHRGRSASRGRRHVRIRGTGSPGQMTAAL